MIPPTRTHRYFRSLPALLGAFALSLVMLNGCGGGGGSDDDSDSGVSGGGGGGGGSTPGTVTFTGTGVTAEFGGPDYDFTPTGTQAMGGLTWVQAPEGHVLFVVFDAMNQAQVVTVTHGTSGTAWFSATPAAGVTIDDSMPGVTQATFNGTSLMSIGPAPPNSYWMAARWTTLDSATDYHAILGPTRADRCRPSVRLRSEFLMQPIHSRCG